MTDSVRPDLGALVQRGAASLISRTLFLVFIVLLSASTFALPASAKTAMQLYVDAMQPGWNLGNTLDAYPDETSWGNPPTTQAMIQQIAASGYKSIRIPITWTSHTGPAPTYTIDPAWMNRVQQIVDWSLQSGLYVMINTHHDSWQWINAASTNHDAVFAQYTAVWTQISTRFAGYSNKLMFESINEPQFSNVDSATAMTLLDQLNTLFVNIVRGTGGANATRPLVLPSLNTNSGQSNIDSLNSTIANLNDPNLIATVHYYAWWPFSVNIAGGYRFDATAVNDIVTGFDNVYNTFVSHGIPVIIGEFGVLAEDHIERGEFLRYNEYVTQYARARDLTTMLWDAGQEFDRNSFQWKDPELRAIWTQSLVGRSTTADTDLIFIKSGSPVGDAIVNLNLNGNGFVSLMNGTTTLSEGDDYKLQGSLLTVKASFLSHYASGAFGEKTVLTVNTNSGPAWKIHVRYYNTAVLSPATGTIGGLPIPTSFNGDLVATMEAKYSDGTDAGPASWTSFQEYGDAYAPDYANNQITMTNGFFTSTHNGKINLAFRFWSGQVVNYQIALEPRATLGGPDLVVYDDTLAPFWQNWSWATVNLSNTSSVHSGANSISVDAAAWGALYFAAAGAPLDATPYHTLTFWANGGPSGGQKINVFAAAGGNNDGFPNYTVASLPANTWTKIQVPLTNLGIEGKNNVTAVWIMNTSGGSEPTFYIDDVSFSTAVSPTDLVVTGTIPPVSPLKITKSGFTLNRRTNHMVQTVTVSNPTSWTVNGPTYLVLDSLSLNTSLANATGTTANVVPTGSPYVTVTSGALAPQASVTVSLEFITPTAGTITYAAHALSGTTP